MVAGSISAEEGEETGVWGLGSVCFGEAEAAPADLVPPFIALFLIWTQGEEPTFSRADTVH